MIGTKRDFIDLKTSWEEKFARETAERAKASYQSKKPAEAKLVRSWRPKNYRRQALFECPTTEVVDCSLDEEVLSLLLLSSNFKGSPPKLKGSEGEVMKEAANWARLRKSSTWALGNSCELSSKGTLCRRRAAAFRMRRAVQEGASTMINIGPGLESGKRCSPEREITAAKRVEQLHSNGGPGWRSGKSKKSDNKSSARITNDATSALAKQYFTPNSFCIALTLIAIILFGQSNPGK